MKSSHYLRSYKAMFFLLPFVFYCNIVVNAQNSGVNTKSTQPSKACNISIDDLYVYGEGCYTHTFNFYITSANPYAVQMNMGDGTIYENPVSPLTHTYDTTGTYQVQLMAIDSLDPNCNDTLMKELVIQPVVADFTPTISQNRVHFTASITGGSGKYYTTWNMGDGTYRYDKFDFDYAYDSVGTYQVMLVAEDYNNYSCKDTMIQTISITDTSSCVIVADFQSYAFDCYQYDFDAYYTDNKGNPYSLSWDMGDSTSYGDTSFFYHMFPANGTYQVCLTATDSADPNCQHIYCQEVVVDEPQGDFTFSITDSVVQFYSNVTHGPGDYEYHWYFGDGNTYTGMDPVHTYSSFGSYEVCLEVYDASAAMYKSSNCIYRVCDSVILDTTGCNITGFYDWMNENSDLELEFTPQINGSAKWTINWFWGDGTSDTTNYTSTGTIYHTYPMEGEYEVCMTVQDDSDINCSDTYCSTVSINLTNPVSFDYNVIQGCAPVNAYFTNTSNMNIADSIIFKWVMEVDYQEKIEYEGFKFPDTMLWGGNYNMRLEAYDTAGNWLGDHDAWFYLDGSRGKFHASTGPEACPGEEVIFMYEGNYEWLEWDFGDGKIFTDNYFPYTFSDTGQYDIILFLSTQCGMDTIVQTMNITNNAPANAQLATKYGNTYCPNDDVFFMTPSTGTYQWDFGDGYTSNKQNPIHRYTREGQYNVVLTVTNLCGSTDSDTLTLYIVNDMMIEGGFDYWSESGCPNTPIHFNGYSPGSHFWEFGDGEVSSKPEPIHAYQDTGTYMIKHIVTNGCGYSDTTYQEINIQYDLYFNMPWAGFYIEGKDINMDVLDTVRICPGETLWFNNYSGGGYGETPVMFDWIIGGLDTIRSNNLEYTFNTEGLHLVQLVAFNACMASDTAEAYIYVDATTPPVADLGHAPDTLCPGEKVYFFDNLFKMSSGNHYNIYFGDGDSLMHITGQSGELGTLAEHTYSTVGSYPFKFEAVNLCGNTVTDTGTIVVDTDSTRKPFYHVHNSTQSYDESYLYQGDLFVNMVREDSIPFIVFVNDSIYRIGIADMPEDPDPLILSEGLYTHDSVGMTVEFLNDKITCGSQMGYYSYEYIEDSLNMGSDTLIFLLTNDPCLERQNILAGNAFFFTETGDGEQEDHSVCPGDPVYFEIAGGISYEWHFGDNSAVSYEQFPTHTYESVGMYEAFVIATNSCGRTDTLPSPVKVDSVNLPEPWFDVHFPDGNITYREVHFSYQPWNEAADVYTYRWEFGDGATSTDRNPVHTYTASGNYAVWLYVENGCGSSTAKQEIFIEEGSPYDCSAEFTFYIHPNKDSVSFYDESPGLLTNWKWTFGDGSSSTAQNPNHVYQQSGYYDVCLNVYDSVSGCSDQYCDVVHIQIDTTDTISCYANYEYVVDLSTVSFSNASQGNITNYFWEFGDGTTDSIKDPVHTYAESGYYEVCLTVYDSVSGCIDAFCQKIEVVDTTGITQCNADYGYFIEGTTVTFTDKSKGDITNYMWDFGDGKYADSANAVHTYAREDYYEVCLTVYDSVNDCMDEYCKTIEVLDTSTVSCNADFSNYIEYNTVHFNNKSQGNLTHYMWDFGDGAFADSADAVHQYESPGLYKVCLTVYDEQSECMDEYCKVIQVMFEDTTFCQADFSKVVSGSTVTFTDKSQGNITNYMWDFGDGNFSAEANPAHTYQYTDFFEVHLTVYDSVSGCMADYSKVIQVMADERASCKAEFSQLVSDNTVRFSNKSQGDITSYMWEFGDGTYGYTANPTHAYEHPDFYKVWLTVYDSVSGCIDEYSKTIQVIWEDTEACNAEFTRFVNNLQVEFTDKSQGSITSYFWSFGDGNYAYTANPSHIYDHSDFYEVCLTVYDSVNGCMDDYCKMIQIIDTTAELCNADFSKYVQGSTVQLNDRSDGTLTNYFWSFGDGVYAYEKNPTHTYKAPGFYEVCLSVFDKESGCLDDQCKVIQIVDSSFANCQADFSFFAEGSKVSFKDKSSGDFTDYLWSFDDGNYAYTANPTHQYNRPGYYQVNLSIYDKETGRMDEHERVIQIVQEAVASCKADFSYHTEQKKVAFNNKSQGNLTDYFWNLGDGSFAYKQNVSHTYNEPGYYEVVLNVYDSQSECIDEQLKVVAVIDTSATEAICNARFEAYNNQDSVFFKPTALGDYSSIFWDFGDDYNSNAENPVHVYEKPGYYDVYLTVMDATTGCFNSRFKTVYVEGLSKSKAVELNARFEHYADSTSMKVTFEDKSYGNTSSWYWDFGDNSPANSSQNPKYSYTQPGYYNVCLTVGDGGATQNTRCKTIAVGNVADDVKAFFTYFADSVTSTGHFHNESRGKIDKYLWDFGDGYSSEQEHPSHTYADTGVYAVCLTATNSTSGISKTFCRKVRIGSALENPCVYSCVWPGDANSDLETNHYDIMTLGLNFGLTGPARDSVSNRWIGHYGQNWSTYQLDGTNNKHGDCNGDGIINWQDTLAISQNFAYSHYEQPGAKSVDWVLSCDWLDTKAIGKRKAKVQLGPPVKNKEKGNIYGLGFEVEVLNASDSVLFSQSTVDFGGSWMGVSDDNLITFSRKDSVKNKIYFGVARNDGQNLSGDGGVVVEVTFAFKEGYDPNKAVLKVTSLGGVLAGGTATNIGGSLTVDLGNDIEMCQGETSVLTVPEGFESYEWSNGEKTNSIEVTQAGTYSVTVTDTSGVSGSDQLAATVHELPDVDLGPDLDAYEDTTLDAGTGFDSYLWSNNEESQKITVNSDGAYSVTVTNQYGCSNSDTVNVTILSVGIQDNEYLQELSIYPNPAEDLVNIEFTTDRRQKMRLELVDQNGRKVYQRKLGRSRNYKEKLDVGKFARGVYYLRIIKEENVVGIEKVIIH